MCTDLSRPICYSQGYQKARRVKKRCSRLLGSVAEVYRLGGFMLCMMHDGVSLRSTPRRLVQTIHSYASSQATANTKSRSRVLAMARDESDAPKKYGYPSASTLSWARSTSRRRIWFSTEPSITRACIWRLNTLYRARGAPQQSNVVYNLDQSFIFISHVWQRGKRPSLHQFAFAEPSAAPWAHSASAGRHG